ncbi:MAG TPA: hypothetical protein VGZ22_04265, partial [Isosphaeraceae bacterium]|nr:hypothetical protein [Isosphaeraceae bacterium]
MANPEKNFEAEAPTAEYPAARRRAPLVRVDFGALTHPGNVRVKNEDHFLVAKLAKSMRICKTSLANAEATQFSDDEGYLMVVADGMGGAAGGEQASALAVESVEG